MKLVRAEKSVALMLTCGFVAATPPAFAQEPLVIRGDQARSLLSDVPVVVESSPEIFVLNPRRTERDELISLLSQVELFTTPPAKAGQDKLSSNENAGSALEKAAQSGDRQ